MSINIGRRVAVVSTPLSMLACVLLMPIVRSLFTRCVRLMYELLR